MLSKFSLQRLLLTVTLPVGLESRLEFCVLLYLETMSDLGLVRRFLQRLDFAFAFDDHAISMANDLRQTHDLSLEMKRLISLSVALHL